MKKLIALLSILFVFEHIYAQKHQITDKDTLWYYAKESGKLVKEKDSADYFWAIMPADSSSGAKVYPVYEYDKKLKTILSAYSTTQQVARLNYTGPYTIFYSNGKKRAVVNYNNGKLTGNMILYYPNGQLYSYRMHADDGRVLFVECRDSTGKILAQGGNGNWIFYDNNFKTILDEGAVKDSLEDGEWREKVIGYGDYVTTYSSGKQIACTDKRLEIRHHELYAMIGLAPANPDFYNFISKNMRYPEYAKIHNIQGKVYIQFVVGPDGSIGNIKILRSPDQTLSDEAIRVIELSPKWQPGIQNNIAVRTLWTVPIDFNL